MPLLRRRRRCRPDGFGLRSVGVPPPSNGDFGAPDQLRELVEIAHQNGIAVLMDLVFNHTSNTFNPLWDAISDGTPGGFYFSGGTPWGNPGTTEREEVQNYLIDVAKLLLKEYHVDGFRL